MTNAWNTNSWQGKSCKQVVNYPSQERLHTITEELSTLPPLVSAQEIEQLKTLLAETGEGKRFILHAGDCAERFDDCHEASIKNRLLLLLQMSVALSYNLHKPVSPIGRIAGQYCKPRSNEFEKRDAISNLSYRGDLVNSIEFNELARTADPRRLLQGYNCSAMTLNYIRSLLDDSLSHLLSDADWHFSFSKNEAYRLFIDSLRDSLDFLSSLDHQNTQANSNDFFISHEALNLHYEQAMTRRVANKWYNLSTHLPWVGVRTNEIDHAHIEYIRGLSNPIAIKVGCKMTPEWLTELITTLNPDNDPGKLNFITRFGVDQIEQSLPPLLQAAEKTGINVQWLCDPMHGNSFTTHNQFKTRRFSDIATELEQAAHIHHQFDSQLAGIHLEVAAESVKECLGGSSNITETDLTSHNYQSTVDPRLNREQAIEFIINCTELMRDAVSSVPEKAAAK